MKIASWNIRGLNRPLKQNDVRDFIKKYDIDIMGVLETKLEVSRIKRVMRNKFYGFRQINNFNMHDAGRILILWNPLKIGLEVVECTQQAIHCLATCKVTSFTFNVSFVYAFHTVVTRRPLWNNLMDLNISLPWLILGDFNNVLKFDEKCNGLEVTPYEIRDFENACLHTGLTDLRSTGCFYTWTNNTMWSKLDRAMVNEIWLQNSGLGFAEFLPSGCNSDHSPCIVSFLDRNGNSRRPFRFFNMWANHDNFLEVVDRGWNSSAYGTKQFILCKKLQKLKSTLKDLNAKHFGHISTRAKLAKLELEDSQKMLHDQPTCLEYQILVADLRKKVMDLCEAERSFYYQQAKCNFIIKSDKCTKFFHAMVKRNTKKNFIAKILKDDGYYTESQEEVANQFVKYYSNLLGTKSPNLTIDEDVVRGGPVVNIEQGDALTQDISSHEIKEALFDIGDDKSPGPDGYSSCFFKKAWGTIETDFVDGIKEFFNSGSLLKQLNHTIIALVPKSSHTTSVEDFRPISCCNVFYKVISKILAARLRPILGSIVDQAQSAFVEGRSMMENIHLAQELMRQYNRKRVAPRCLLKVDLRKAYDSVEWGFLKQMLEGLGFPTKFIGWVMECVTTTSYSVALNGSLHGHFKGNRGLRQGDPLSPFLFVLCIEYLSRMLKVATYDSDFNFHPKCGPLRISHLAFADDLMLFARGDIISVSILMDCLNKFGEVSGLRMNNLKSSLFTAGIFGHDLEDIQDVINIPRGTMPFRYLGIPLAAEKLKVSCYAPFLDKIATYISSWTCSYLSYAGRAELIRAVLQGVECFWLSLLPIPATIISRIQTLCRNFLWSSKKTPSWLEGNLLA